MFLVEGCSMDVVFIGSCKGALGTLGQGLLPDQVDELPELVSGRHLRCSIINFPIIGQLWRCRL